MTRRALVVDDDRSMVKTLSDILALKGWQVHPAYSGEMAIRAATQEPFDVVLMDVKMPGIDGVDAFKAIKRARPDIRVILMTAYAAPERVAEAEREGVVRVLSKPVDVAELFQLLTEKLNGDRPVLLIDHDTAFLRTLAEVLRLEGFEVATATDLPDATRLMAARRPMAVFLHLPAGSGTVRGAIAAVHHANPAAAIIAYSGQADAEAAIANEVPRDWVHAYLRKPFAVEAVTHVLDGLRHG